MKDARWQEISQLYFKALELPESEREIFLRTCKDEGIRQEVLRFWRTKPRCEAFSNVPLWK
jgi:hypothetical protein